MFKPKQVFFEEQALNYPLGQALWNYFEKLDAKVEMLSKSNRVTKIEGETQKEKYEYAKDVLVVGVRKTLEFENCKPSAHYQMPLVTGCMGMCEYCYLNTRLANRSYVRIYVNIEEILEKTKKYIEQRKPEITIFEAAATSDPIPVEEYTNNLAKAIEFMAEEEYGRLRFVTKYPFVDSLLELKHNGHTQIRFSMNTDFAIKQYEHRTASMEKRIEALCKVAKAGYPVGIIIAPVFIYENWKQEYEEMLKQLKEKLKENELESIEIEFEVITHRYTTSAKNKILEFYPETNLPMQEEERKYKYGQFGYGKYIYKPEQMEEVKHFFKEKIEAEFPNAKIRYII